MRLTCSACGAHGSIEQFTSDADARTAMAMALAMPAGVGAVALRYIALFRPGKRGLTWDRVCKLLGEIAEMVKHQQVERRGRIYPASPALIAAAMQQMVDMRDRLELPLTSHGYLATIVAGDSPKEAAALEAAEESRKRTESSRRAPAAETPFERSLRERRAAEAAAGANPAVGGIGQAIKRVD